MPITRSLTTGNHPAGVHIAYVKSRRVLRLQSWDGESQRVETVEVPLRTLLEHLGADVADLDLPRRYLIFSGQGRPGGGARDLSGVFECEQEARAAFHEIRRLRSPSSWAQLVVLDHLGCPKPLCWFEANPPSPTLTPDVKGETSARPPRRRRWAILEKRRRTGPVRY